jgi:hypothetical protein
MNDPIAMLKQDHREAAAILKELAESKPGAARPKTTEKLVAALTLHMAIEEPTRAPVGSQARRPRRWSAAATGDARVRGRTRRSFGRCSVSYAV